MGECLPAGPPFSGEEAPPPPGGGGEGGGPTRIILLSDCRLGSASVVAECDSTDSRLMGVRFLCGQKETAKRKRQKGSGYKRKGIFPLQVCRRKFWRVLKGACPVVFNDIFC